MVAEVKIFRLCWVLGIAKSDRSATSWTKFKSKSLTRIPQVDQIPILRTSSAVNPSTGQGPHKWAKPKVATCPKSPKSPNVPTGPPHPRNPADVPGFVPGEMDSHPQREPRGAQMPFPGTGTPVFAENQAIIEPSTRVVQRTNAAPSRTGVRWPRQRAPSWSTLTPLRLYGGCQSPRSGRTCLRQGPSALLLTTRTLRIVESARPHLTPRAIWVRFVMPWPNPAGPIEDQAEPFHGGIVAHSNEGVVAVSLTGGGMSFLGSVP